MRITQANQEDQEIILQLEQTIFDDMALDVYQELSVQDVQEAWLMAVQRSEKSRYHYKRALVAKNEEHQVLGVLFGYPDTDEPILDDDIQNVLADKYSYHKWLFGDTEVFENEWYIDSIVVSQQARGQGIGKKLLDAAQIRAQQEGFETVGLNVDDANPRAMKLYENIGFQSVGRLTIANHEYTHMQKN